MTDLELFQTFNFLLRGGSKLARYSLLTPVAHTWGFIIIILHSFVI